MRRQFAAALVALMLVTAGCSGFGGPGDGGEPGDGTSGDATGSITFYISDQPGAIDDFEHLNVTVTRVGFHRTNASAEGDVDGNETDGVEDDESGWQEYEVDDRTVDLTRLQGANATALEEFEVRNGTYDRVFIHVDEVDGTLTDGSSAEVKLPSSKLRLDQEFVVGNNESVDFVYDINVVKRGNSGKYNIKPVAGESGTDVDIEEVGEADDREGDDSDDDESAATPTPDESAQQSMGQVAFYVSDQQNAIDDFDHVTVSVTAVGFQRGGESGNWTEYEVDDRTVDLTRLQGDNATLLRTFDLPKGNYTKVFIHVGEVDGTLTDGSSTEVKLPSSKLQLNENFEVAANESVDFVYDITVVKRGNSGKYNIKPVASESGTDVPIERVDGEDDFDTGGDGNDSGSSEDDFDTGDDENDSGAEVTTAFDATFVGKVTRGGNATVSVSQNGTAVENATVTYDGTAYLTDADGNVTFAVPGDAEEVEVEIEYDDRSATLTAEGTAEWSGGDASNNEGSNAGNASNDDDGGNAGNASNDDDGSSGETATATAGS
jgi:hypothetical protein